MLLKTISPGCGLWASLVLFVQIWHVVVTGFQGVPYFKVTLNSHVLKVMLSLHLKNFFSYSILKITFIQILNFACICNWP